MFSVSQRRREIARDSQTACKNDQNRGDKKREQLLYRVGMLMLTLLEKAGKRDIEEWDKNMGQRS